jgi:hypothetical protein
LIVPDYDDAIGFFCKGLGWTLCEDVAQGHKRWVTVQPPGGGCRIVLAQPADPTQNSAIGAQGGGRVWLFLHTDDLSQLVPSLKKSPAMNPMGAWRFGAILGATDGT